FVSTSLNDGVTWAELADLAPSSTAPIRGFAPVLLTPTSGVVIFSEEEGPSDADLFLRTFTVPADPGDAVAVGWDVYDAGDPNGAILGTLTHAYDRSFRDELQGAGKGSFKINRHAP